MIKFVAHPHTFGHHVGSGNVHALLAEDANPPGWQGVHSSRYPGPASNAQNYAPGGR